jgi:hypothetical protein
MEIFYKIFEKAFVALHPIWNWIGYERVERPVAALEKVAKGFLFDCQMCGQCALSSTGMSCSMNCPKNIRNGPCGGVRANGNCEVKPEMRCVWVEAFAGSERMVEGKKAIRIVQLPVDRRLEGRSSWLKVARERNPLPPIAIATPASAAKAACTATSPPTKAP